MTMRPRSLVPAFLAAALLAPAGCNIITPALYVAQGPPKTPAEFTLPKDRKTVVFVDDRRSAMSRLQLRAVLADDIGQSLKSLELVDEVVSGRELIAYVRRNESATKRIAIEDLGRAVNADVVVYVEMEAFVLSPDGATPKPTAMARIKVIDVKEEKRLFPPDGADPAGYPVVADMNALGNEAYRTSASRRRLEDLLAKRLALKITQLFHEHDPKGFGQGVTTSMEG